MVRPPGSRGGQATEAGSPYRSGVAAYPAAHGLAGRGVKAAGYPEGGPAPVTLAFETGQAVDDISAAWRTSRRWTYMHNSVRG